jgi:hypothetical protein
MNRHDAIGGARRSSVSVNTSQARTSILGHFDQRCAVAHAGINSRIRGGGNQKRPNVLGFLDR